MTWFDILKVMQIMDDNQLKNNLPNFQTSQEKGYPSILDNLTFVVELAEDGKVMSYTSFMEFDKFFFVGNGYTVPEFRGSNTWRDLISMRDTILRNRIHYEQKPRITLLNPQEDTEISRLHSIVIGRGWREVKSYDDVKDIMDEQKYNQLSILPMYRSG